MAARDSAHTDRIHADLHVLLEEIWSLALDGGIEPALRLLEDLPADQAADLLKARLLLLQGSSNGRLESARSLRLLSEASTANAWRARLELARILRRETKTTEAATVLRQAVEEF